MAALLGVLVLGILQGVALGVVLSLAVLVRRVSYPVTAILGRLPETNDYRDVAIHPEAETLAGLLIFHFDAPIIFCNAGFFAAQIREHITTAETPIHEVLLAAQQINQLDSTGADQLERLLNELAKEQIKLSFAEAKTPLREMMRRTELYEKIGANHFHESIEDGVRAFLERQEQTPSDGGLPT